ncbi:hypothetical protein LGM46_18105 [Burkholderia arboris]|uniref:hypothetical protein n=1 Tax=Burkholderia arboris TaxID=488730 RepID=UPI001CF329EA|nr:hypothetical protein [Burkholderia arboris]MCA8034879.1 hypothetical protein [Burkholderia arboris]
MTETEELQLVTTALRNFLQRIDEIIELLEGRTRISDDERHHVQSLYTSLKSDLKAAAKTGTVTGKNRPMTETESAFFDGTVRESAAFLRAPTNSHPIKSNWVNDLIGIRVNFSHALSEISAYKRGAGAPPRHI